MGQGLYDGIGFGVLDDLQLGESLSELEHWDSLLHTSSECESQYVVMSFGVSDGFLQEYWGLADVPLEAPRVKSRTARIAEDVDVPHRVRAAWDLLRIAGAERGIVVPEGLAIAYSDYD